MTLKKITGWIIFVFLLILGVYYFYPEKKLPSNVKIDYLLVHKSERKLMAFSHGILIKTYTISLGKNPIGHKEYQGDKKTPEGPYIISEKNSKSAYYKNLGISYPNRKDIQNAKKLKKSTGGDVKIHGLKNGIGFIGKFHRWYDWTLGCIALNNDEMDELYQAVNIGTKIEIKP